MTLRVYYEDTDMGGIVYHSNYLNFCERARSELFFSKQQTPIFEGGHFVVRRIEADFKGSARLGDLLDVTAEVLEIKGATLRMRQHVLRGGELLFAMDITLVYLMENGRLGRLDEARRAKLLALLVE